MVVRQVVGTATTVLTGTASAAAGVVVGDAFGGIPGAMGALAGSLASTAVSLTASLAWGAASLGVAGARLLASGFRGAGKDDPTEPHPDVTPVKDPPEFGAECYACRRPFAIYRWSGLRELAGAGVCRY